jgi:hypothetical protein
MIYQIIFGAPSNGNNAPERKNVGMMMKFIMSWNHCISSSFDATAVPKAVKSTAIKNMNPNATTTMDRLSGLNPISIEMKNTMIPCNEATVAPPSVLPNMILYLETGATNVSLRNPNCLSRITSIPLNIAVKRILMAMMPGARNSI